MATTDRPTNNSDQKTIVHQQLALLEDMQGQKLQSRFENFCADAVNALIATNEHGNPCFEAGKVSSKFTIEVEVMRTSDDALNFQFIHTVKSKHPHIPGRVRSSPFVRNIGLAQRVTHKQNPLFDPADGQPTPQEIAEAEATMEE